MLSLLLRTIRHKKIKFNSRVKRTTSRLLDICDYLEPLTGEEMYDKMLVSSDMTRVIVKRSSHNRFKGSTNDKNTKARSQSTFNTKNYTDALQRAFNTVKTNIYFNPDMRLFVTLTYKGKTHTPENVLYDIKQFVKNQKRKTNITPKYAFVLEYQKRGSIHVHMICNEFFQTEINQNGYRSILGWRKGYSSVLTLSDFDKNFKPYLYLFKYMSKAQRIGKSFVHTSRGLSKAYSELESEPWSLENYKLVNYERKTAFVDDLSLTFYTLYYKYDKLDTLLNKKGQDNDETRFSNYKRGNRQKVREAVSSGRGNYWNL